MNIKAVVKVMNFQSLLRVESSRAVAEKYVIAAEELEKMMWLIFNNKNLKIDKKLTLPNKNNPVLKIYIGSDYGFCGNVNSSMSSKINADKTSGKIIIGKKIKKNTVCELFVTQEQLTKDFSPISDLLDQITDQGKWSKIYLCYNHYVNSSKIVPTERQIFPLVPDDEEDLKENYTDYAIEGDVTELMEDMVAAYLVYEIKIALASSYASENIMRQNATTESLKKLDEIEAKEIVDNRKLKNSISFQKTIDSFVKQKSLTNSRKR